MGLATQPTTQQLHPDADPADYYIERAGERLRETVELAPSLTNPETVYSAEAAYLDTLTNAGVMTQNRHDYEHSPANLINE